MYYVLSTRSRRPPEESMYTQVRGFGFDYKGTGGVRWGREHYSPLAIAPREKGSFVVMNDTKIYYEMRGRRKEKLT